jgi:hypothetical protein
LEWRAAFEGFISRDTILYMFCLEAWWVRLLWFVIGSYCAV